MVTSEPVEPDSLVLKTEDQAGARPRQPNFFVIGAPKCGTTALCNYLRGHPQVYIPRTKEPHFFARDLWQYASQYYKSRDDYLSLFADAPEEAIALGEGSVFYAFSNVAIAGIHAFDPRAKIIMMVRNPADMVYSLHGQYVFNNTDCESEADFEKAWRLQDERLKKKAMPARLAAATDRSSELLQYRLVGRFADQLNRVFEYFPKEQVKVILFEDFRSDTKKTYEETLSFLGLATDGRTDFPRIKESKVRRFKALHHAVVKLTSFRPLVHAWRRVKRAAGIESLGLRRLIEKKTAMQRERQSLPAELRQEILKAFKDDIDQLSRLIGRDLSHWK